MEALILSLLILSLPVLALIWLVLSIIRFCRTSKENIEKRKALKKQIAIAAIIIALWFVVIGGFLLFIIYSIDVYGM